MRIPRYLRQVLSHEQAKPQVERSGDLFLVRHPNRIAYANAVALDVLASFSYKLGRQHASQPDLVTLERFCNFSLITSLGLYHSHQVK